MKIKDLLEDGMVVQLRDKRQGIVKLSEKTINLVGGGFVALSDYNDNLTVNVQLESFRKFDIVKVWKLNSDILDIINGKVHFYDEKINLLRELM